METPTKTALALATQAGDRTAFGLYRREAGTDVSQLFGLLVLSVEGEQVASLVAFLDLSSLSSFAFPVGSSVREPYVRQKGGCIRQEAERFTALKQEQWGNIPQGKNKTMRQQHEADLVKRLEQLGIEVVVSPTGTTLKYEQIYTSGSTFEEAFVTFLGEALSRYEALRTWKANLNWSDKHETPDR